jgi:hypothetical protein
MASRVTVHLWLFAGLVALWAAVATPAQAQQPSAVPLTKAQLDQLVAPIALHPDPLLSQMLMASTYPTEVVQAARWARENPSLTGQALQNAVQRQPWDPSVKALTAVPQALEMMSDKLDWTQQLGDAFLAQQDEVLAAVQRLRLRAEAAGHLKTSDQQTISKAATPTEGGTTPIIAIAPPNPEYVSLPVYDPRVVYGDWPHPDYQPAYWQPAGFTGRGILSFATGVAAGSAMWGNFDWRRGRVDIDVNRYNQFNRTNIVDTAWRHDPRHRGNVPYRDAKVAQHFGDTQRAAAREAYRSQADVGRRDLAKAAKSNGEAKAKPGADTKSAGHAKHAGRAPGGDKAKSPAKAKSAAHTKQAVKGKSAAHAQQSGKHAAKPKQASRPSAHRPQATRPTARKPQGHAYRPVGGGHRMSMHGGGPRHGGGGRRGRR